MVERQVKWCVMVVLVSATSCLAVEQLTITTMTYSYQDGIGNKDETNLVVCETNPLTLTAEDIIRLVVKTYTSQNSYDGKLSTDSPKCAEFSVADRLPLPYEVSTYKLTVSSSVDGTEQSSGSVTFANPIDKVEAINCGATKVARLTLTAGGAAPTNCIEGSGSETTPCYLDMGSGDTVCLTGLDSSSDVEVCAVSSSTVGTSLDAFAVSYIQYLTATTALVATTHDDIGTVVSTELLTRVVIDGDFDDVKVHSCTDAPCTLNPFSPSPNNYELCGVFVDSAGELHVGTTEFQDLKLTVDSTSPTVDFHMYNAAGYYNVYEDPIDLNLLDPGSPSFTLDCTLIPLDSYCNGFFETDGSVPSSFAVSYENGANVVATGIIYVPPFDSKARSAAGGQ